MRSEVEGTVADADPIQSSDLTRNRRTDTICSRCVMDGTDPAISFDPEGVCNHCRAYEERAARELYTGEAGRARLKGLVERIRTEGRGPAVPEGNFFHSSVRVYINVSASAGCNGLFAIRMDCHLPLWQGVPVDSLHRRPVPVQVLDSLPGLCGRQSFLLRLLALGLLDRGLPISIRHTDRWTEPSTWRVYLAIVITVCICGGSRAYKYPTLSSPTREKFDIVDRPHPQTSEGF